MELTVVMPVYQQDIAELKIAVESILNQTYRDFCFMIIDDGSSEDVLSYLGQIARVDSRIKLISNNGNRGLTYSLNRGLRLATTPWVARMDSDDIASPERFMRQMQHLAKHPETTVLATRAKYIENGRLVPSRTLPCSHNEITSILPFGCVFVHPTIILNREQVVAAGGYPDCRSAEDFALWERLLFKPGSCFACLPEVLLQYRKGNKSKNYRIQQRESSRLIRKWVCESLGTDCIPYHWLHDIDSKLDCASVDQSLREIEEVCRAVRKRFPNTDEGFLRLSRLRERKYVLFRARKLSLSYLSIYCKNEMSYFVCSILLRIRQWLNVENF